MPVAVSESLKYVVITPARNEARFIELTLKSGLKIGPTTWEVLRTATDE
jgi:hypothetical protein